MAGGEPRTLASKLSPTQKDLLRELWRITKLIDARLAQAGPDDYLIRWALGTGVPYRGATRGATPSWRASVSRALRRLEARGLLIRINRTTGSPGLGGWKVGEAVCYEVRSRLDQPAPKRADHVKLTDDGRAVAEWLECLEEVKETATG